MKKRRKCKVMIINLLGKRRLPPSTSRSFLSLMHMLSQVHFTRWTPEGRQSTFSKRRALSPSMLSSTTTWVTAAHSELSNCPPICWICLRNIWHLAFPIPAGRRYTVTPLKGFPPLTSNSSGFFFIGGASCPCSTLALLTLGKAFMIPWRGSISPSEERNRWPAHRDEKSRTKIHTG